MNIFMFWNVKNKSNKVFAEWWLFHDLNYYHKLLKPTGIKTYWEKTLLFQLFRTNGDQKIALFFFIEEMKLARRLKNINFSASRECIAKRILSNSFIE